MGDVYVFVDCEMSGLSPDVDHITEISMIVTRAADMRCLAEFSSVIHYSDQFLRAQLSDWCKRTHSRNGLLHEIRAAPPTLTLQQVEANATSFLARFVPPPPASVYLCGNNIGHDRKFIEKYMPALARMFNPVLIELNVLLKCAQTWNPDLRARCPKKVNPLHRSLADARSSYNLALYFCNQLFRSGGPPSMAAVPPMMMAAGPPTIQQAPGAFQVIYPQPLAGPLFMGPTPGPPQQLFREAPPLVPALH